MGLRLLIIAYWCCLIVGLTSCSGKEVEDDDGDTPSTPVTSALSIAPFSVSESTGGKFLFKLSAAQPSPVAFTWTISQISASPSGRFSVLSGSVTIPAGQTSSSVTIPLVNDSIYQQDQDFKLTLSGATTGLTVPTPSITFTVLDDDSAPKVGFAVSSQTVAEASGTATVTVNLSNPSATATTATFSIGGTATAGSDYSTVTPASTLSFAAGETSKTISVPIINDSTPELDETVIFTLTGATGGTVNSSQQTHTLTIANDDGPNITQVTSSQADGSYSSGTIPITVQFSRTVTVTGSPVLKLETGTVDHNAVYASGSGTTNLVFNYVIQVGDTSNDLDYFSTSALTLSGGTIKDSATSLSAQLTLPTPGAANSLGANKALVIDTTAPTVTNVTSLTTNGIYTTGATISVTAAFSEPVIVTGNPTLLLETGTTDRNATYVSGSGTSTLTFSYTVQSGDASSDLDQQSTSALSANGGTIRDAAGNNAVLTLAAPGAAGSLGANKAIVIDTAIPTILGVSSSAANGSYSTGAVIPVRVTFSKTVFVTGTPKLTLETGTTDEVVSYTSGSGSSVLVFNYTVQAGDTNSLLDYISTSALSLNGGSIVDSATNAADLTLATPGTSGSLSVSKSISIDTTAPSISSVSSSTANGYYKSGGTIDVTVTFSEAVAVTGTPRLQLETGTTDEWATYLSGSGSTTLTFRYTIASGDTSTHLDYVSTTALGLNGGTIKDLTGNAATLTLPAVGGTGSLSANTSLIVDTDLPTTPTSVNDGTWTTTTAQAPTVSWGASTDATSGVDHYEYALGTTSGGTDVVTWTANGTALSRTQASLSLTEGTYYYASVRAVDLAGNISPVATGDGFRADATAPNPPATFDDGVTSPSTTQTPTFSWTASTDSVSGLDHYEIALGTSSGATDLMTWTDVGTGTTKVTTGLSLTEGHTYYASIRAVDQAGNVGTARAGDGWTIGWLQQAYLKAANVDASDSFGTSVAISGDTMVVGVPNESSSQTTITNGATASSDNSASGAGAVYVYVRSGSTWTQQAYIKAGNAAAGDNFGQAVAIDTDTIVVGAPAEDGSSTGIFTSAQTARGSTSSGAVYIYKRTGTSWALEAYVKASNAGSSDTFGSAVAISANTVVVGSPNESSNATGTATTASSNNSLAGAGAAYVYVRSGTTWTLQSYLKPATAHAVAFGTSVAISTDTIAVGAPLDSSSRTTITNGTGGSNNTSKASAGAVYAFLRSGTTWTQQAYLKPTNTHAGDKLGSSVAISGDLIVAGAPYEASNAQGPSATASTDASNTASGAAYVFSRSSTTWSLQSYLKAANSGSGDHFGTSVGIDGSLIVVGSPDENASDTSVIQGSTASSNTSATSAGAAYLYRVSGTTWSELAYLKAPNAEASDAFGNACAISGSSLAIGATLEDSNQSTITNGLTASSDNSKSGAGAVYLFNR